MSTAQQRTALGNYGERVAARYLADAGIQILDRNWRCRDGEIDLVLRDGSTLVFCEVKTRRDDDHGHPVAAVTQAKLDRLYLLGCRWMEQHSVRADEVRLDVVAVWQDGHGAALVEHLAGIG